MGKLSLAGESGGAGGQANATQSHPVTPLVNHHRKVSVDTIQAQTHVTLSLHQQDLFSSFLPHPRPAPGFLL